MYEVIFLVILAFIWILVGTIQDLRMKEVSNWLNFSLIIFALGFRFFYSLFGQNGFGFFYQGLIGLGIFLVLGNLFYYSRLFAGGDAKMMIALGAILPFSENFYTNLNIFFWFFILFVFVGAIYGFVWSIFLTIKNFKLVRKEVKYSLIKKKKLFYSVLGICILLILFGFFDLLFLVAGLFILILSCFYLFANSIEKCCMLVKISSNDLRPGDWLAENIKISKGKTILKNWEGLNEKEIKMIQKKYKFVKIKQGIAFMPVFLVSFIVLVYLWFFNLLWNFRVF